MELPACDLGLTISVALWRWAPWPVLHSCTVRTHGCACMHGGMQGWCVMRATHVWEIRLTHSSTCLSFPTAKQAM